MMPLGSVKENLEHVRGQISEMTNHLSEMIMEAVEGAVTADTARLKAVIERDAIVDRMEEEAIAITFGTIVMQAPAGKAARFLAGGLSIIGELENACDDVVKLAKRARKVGDKLPAELGPPLGALAEGVVQMLHNVIDLIDHYNEEKCQAFIESDSLIDQGYKAARNRVLEIAEHGTLNREVLRMVEMFHALEHVADHLVEIARRIRLLHQPL